MIIGQYASKRPLQMKRWARSNRSGSISIVLDPTGGMLSWQRVHNSHIMDTSAGGRRTNKQLSKEGDARMNKEKAFPFVQWGVMSLEQLEVALGQSEEELHLLLSDKLEMANSHVCMREAALLQYYLQGLCWAQDAHLSPLQTSFTMAVLDTLLHNVTEKGMDFVDNVLEFAKALAVACHCPPATESPSSLLSPEEVQSLIRFIRDSLFQKYQLFKALNSGQEDLLLGIEETVDVLWSQDALPVLEEGIATHLVTLEADQ